MKNTIPSACPRWAVCGVLVAVMAMPSAFAAEAAKDLSKVEVTGSRIRQVALEGMQPVLTLTRDDIDRTGFTSLGELLQALPQSGSALNTKFNSSGNFGFPPSGSGVGAGSTEVDLRHLGSQRALVLVDGLRWVDGSSASGVSAATDLNTIPLSIVDSVEILRDGASAVYGSDAIAGVINIKTKKEFEGLAASALFGEFSEGDGTTTKYEFTLGKTGPESSVLFNVSYTDQERVNAADRSQSAFPTPNTGLTRGSSATPQGRFLFTDPNTMTFNNLTINDGVGGIPFYDPANPTMPPSDFHAFTNNDRFNFSQFNLVLTPNERRSVYAQGHMDITDNIKVRGKAVYNNRTSVNQAAPEPIFIGPVWGIGGLADTVSIDVTNPFNPFGFTLDADPVTGNFLGLGRRPVEVLPRIFTQEVNTWYFSGGFEGSVDAFQRTFDWNLDYVFSTNQANQIKQGAWNLRKIKEAVGPAFMRADGTFGCGASAAEEILGCVPLNLFGGQGANGQGTITPEMVSWSGFVQQDSSENELKDIVGNITFDAAQLPAGPLGIAVGFESREQEGFFQPDAIVVNGDTNGIPAGATSGGYDVDSYYAEAIIPILADKRGAELLDVNLAARNADFSTFGSETTTKFGLRYKPTTDLLFRATASEGFRAPSIGELFGSATRFDAVLTDPCSNWPASSDPVILNNCPNVFMVPSTYVQPNAQISVTTGGNPNLEPETSDSFTLGAVYSPSWVENIPWAERFDFEVTYYDYELDDTIQALDAQTQLDSCVQTLDPNLCSGISRNATGAIDGYNNTLTNIGGTDTSGYDFNIVWLGPNKDYGQFGVQWYSTYLIEFNNRVVNSMGGFDEIGLVGIEQNDSAIARWQSLMSTSWQNGPWSVAWNMRYTHHVVESCSDFLDNSSDSFTQLGLCSDPNFNNEPRSKNNLGSVVYHDLQADFDLGTWNGFGASVVFGAVNIFDKEPPICLSCSLNGYDASTYDPPGSQFWYVRLVANR